MSEFVILVETVESAAGLLGVATFILAVGLFVFDRGPRRRSTSIAPTEQKPSSEDRMAA